jgi:hypothetical protein
MQIRACRVHIAGSASANASPELLSYGHTLIGSLVRVLAEKGAVFSVGVGKEPRLQGKTEALPIVFDWTVISTINSCLKSGLTPLPSWQGKVLTTIATQKTDEQIPEDRREIWRELLARDAVQINYLEPGWASGAERRARLAELGDILIILSGGEGVEHLAREYAIRGKPVVPIDLDLGSSTGDGAGGASRLAKEIFAHPDRFFHLSEPTSAGTLLTLIATRNGKSPIAQVTQAMVNLIEAIFPPSAFYVRLLARDHQDYPEVENFFRNVVDSLISELGYTRIEMGLSSTTYPWINEQIFESLHNCAIAVVDLTALRPDCLIELGYTLGRSRRLILTAKEGTALPFDSKMLECYFWEGVIPDDLRTKQLKEYWQRNFNRPALVKPREII